MNCYVNLILFVNNSYIILEYFWEAIHILEFMY